MADCRLAIAEEYGNIGLKAVDTASNTRVPPAHWRVPKTLVPGYEPVVGPAHSSPQRSLPATAARQHFPQLRQAGPRQQIRRSTHGSNWQRNNRLVNRRERHEARQPRRRARAVYCHSTKCVGTQNRKFRGFLDDRNKRYNPETQWVLFCSLSSRPCHYFALFVLTKQLYHQNFLVHSYATFFVSRRTPIEFSGKGSTTLPRERNLLSCVHWRYGNPFFKSVFTATLLVLIS